MCGRFDQNHTSGEYAVAVGWEIYRDHCESGPRYNVAPSTSRPLMHVDGEGAIIEDRHWGYQAAWAVGKVPLAINARIEKIGNGYWGKLLKGGRAIVPADGWYEWTGEKGAKQPWHIHRAGREPLFMAALASFAAPGENKAAAGFAIITADAEGGMVDVHDRRPVVFCAADARLWMDPALGPEQAEQLARSVALGPDAFAWYRVDKAVGNVRNESPALVLELPNQPLL